SRDLHPQRAGTTGGGGVRATAQELAHQPHLPGIAPGPRPVGTGRGRGQGGYTGTYLAGTRRGPADPGPDGPGDPGVAPRRGGRGTATPMSTSEPTLLAVDLGGTHTRLRLANRDEGVPHTLLEQHVRTGDFPDLSSLLKHFFRSSGG